MENMANTSPTYRHVFGIEGDVIEISFTNEKILRIIMLHNKNGRTYYSYRNEIKYVAKNGESTDAYIMNFRDRKLFLGTREIDPVTKGECLLVTKGKSNILDKKDSKGISPVNKAIFENATDIFEKLVMDGGFNIESNPSVEDTPLTYAIEHCNIEIVKELLNRDAEVDEENKGGNTPLACSIINRNIEIVKELLIMGANLDKKDCHGNTPLMAAIECKSCDIVDLLLEYSNKK